jgi:hypothetical protein
MFNFGPLALPRVVDSVSMFIPIFVKMRLGATTMQGKRSLCTIAAISIRFNYA